MFTRFSKVTPLLILLFSIFYPVDLIGQSPYELNWKREIPLLSAGITGRIVGLQIIKKMAPLSESAATMLRPEDINRFDRDAILNTSEAAGTVSDVLLYSSTIAPLTFWVPKKTRNDILTIGVIGLEVLFLNTGTTTMAKALVKRTRPMVYNPMTDTDLESISKTRLSFFSGHTSGTAALSFFSAKVFADYFPDSKWKPVVWSAAALVPAVAAYTRVKSGNHFPTDVITGYTVGALFGILIPQIHKKVREGKNNRFGFSVLALSGGVGLMVRW